MITRKIGKILRGKATPFQIIAAAVLGAMIGFIPGFLNGPGVTIFLLLVLVILNANLAVAGIVGMVAKLLSYLLLPASFHLGRFLMDGPLESFFRWIVNMPVLALFGFDHYATTGGLIIGCVFGIVVGVGLVIAVQRFRRKMAHVEEHSERYKKFAGKFWVKALAWILIGGGRGKKTYAQLMERRVGNPVRPLGAALAVLTVVAVVLVYQFLSGPIVTMGLQRGLEQANGATVDLDSAELDLGQGKLRLTGLAMADPNALDTNLLAADELEADIAAKDLLRKRITFDRVVMREAASGGKRARPGVLIRRGPQPADEPETQPGEKTIDDYLKQAEQWKKRLAQVRDWLERISGPPADDESWTERVKRRAEELGYGRVIAEHLIEGAPTLTILELEADGVKTAHLEGEVLDIRAKNLSTHPGLLEGPPEISITTRSERLAAAVKFDELAKAVAGQPASENAIAFKYIGLPAASLEDSLQFDGDPLLRDGTIDINLAGTWGQKGVGFIDMPLQVTLHDTTIALPGTKPAPIQQMMIPIGLRGPMDNPAIFLDDQLLADALLQAGASELAARAQAEADKLAGKATQELRKKLNKQLGDKVDEDILKQAEDKLGEDVGGALKGLLGGNKSEEDKKKTDDK